MNDVARKKLCEIVAQYGRSICDDPRRVRGLLGDYCPGLKREIHALTTALEQRVVSDLLKSSVGLPWEVVAGRMVTRLIDEVAMNAAAARWTIDSWALALGLATAPRPSPVPARLIEENLLRWQQSGEPQRWVAERRGNWIHDDWIGLLDLLKRSSYWPLEPKQVGLELEKVKQNYLAEQRRATVSRPSFVSNQAAPGSSTSSLSYRITCTICGKSVPYIPGVTAGALSCPGCGEQLKHLGSMHYSYNGRGHAVFICIVAWSIFLFLFPVGITTLKAASQGEFPPPVRLIVILLMLTSPVLTLYALLVVRNTQLDLHERGLCYRVCSREILIAYSEIEAVTVRIGIGRNCVVVRLCNGNKFILKNFSLWGDDFGKVLRIIEKASGLK